MGKDAIETGSWGPAGLGYDRRVPAEDQRSPVEAAQAFLDAFASGEVEAVLDLFTADAVWQIPGDPQLVPWVGTRDRAGIADYIELFGENAELTSFEIEKIVADDEDALIIGRFGNRFASGGELDDPFVIRLTVRDGLISHYVIHEDSLNLARQYVRPSDPHFLP